MEDLDKTEFSREGQSVDEAFGTAGEPEQTEKETPAESSPETNQEGTEESSTSESAKDADDKTDDNVPFHQHPRWKEVYNKAKKVEELEAKIAELSASRQTERQPDTITTVPKPKWFTDLYGDNDTAWQDYQQTQQQMVQQAEVRAVERIKAEQQAEVAKATKAQQYVKDAVQMLKDEGNDFDENKLMKIMSEYRPVDESGANWDFKRGLEIYNLLEKRPSAEAKKKVAASTMKSKSEGGDEAPTIWTPSKLREKYGYR